MDQNLKEILDGDFQFVLISGDYWDCPSCNPGATLTPTSFYDEELLLKHILERVNRDRMEAIWVIDTDSGDMAKYCYITTKTTHHHVQSLEFTLPKTGNIIIHHKDGKYAIVDKTYTTLYAKN